MSIVNKRRQTSFFCCRVMNHKSLDREFAFDALEKEKKKLMEK